VRPSGVGRGKQYKSRASVEFRDVALDDALELEPVAGLKEGGLMEVCSPGLVGFVEPE
jgi:hypothetical protein